MKKAKTKSKAAPTPPPAPKRLPPPPPPPPKKAPELEFVLDLPPQPDRATHLRWQSADRGTTIEVPIGQYGDFSSFKTGVLSWGRVHLPGGEWEAIDEAQGRQDAVAVVAERKHAPTAPKGPPPPPGAKLAPRAPKPAGTGPKKEGVCAFIDARIMEGGRTVEQVLALVMAQFPGRDAAATTSTIKTRPSHIKAKGLVPPAFAK